AGVRRSADFSIVPGLADDRDPSRAARGAGVRPRARQGLAWVVGVAAAALFLAPVLWLVVASFKPSSAIFADDGAAFFSARAWTLDNYASALRRAHLVRATCNSLAQVAAITLGGLLVNAMAAFAFARLVFRARELL